MAEFEVVVNPPLPIIEVEVNPPLPAVQVDVEPASPDVDVVIEPSLPAVKVEAWQVALAGKNGRDGVDGTDGVDGSDPAADAHLNEHIWSDLPHPAYDDGPSLELLYQNAKV